MKSKHQNKKIERLWGVFVLVITILLIISTLIPFRLVTIVVADSRNCKITTPYFTLSWIHSVDRTPWHEFYQRDNRGFILTHTKFRTFGAGVPHDGVVMNSNDGLIHYKIDHFIPEIHWVVDKEVLSTISSSKDEMWPIYQTVDRYSEIGIYSRSFNFWQNLFIRSCYDSK